MIITTNEITKPEAALDLAIQAGVPKAYIGVLRAITSPSDGSQDYVDLWSGIEGVEFTDQGILRKTMMARILKMGSDISGIYLIGSGMYGLNGPKYRARAKRVTLAMTELNESNSPS